MSAAISIAEECHRKIHGPVVKRTKAKPIVYLDKHGEVVTLRELATHYKAHHSVIRKAFVRNNLDYIAAHKELGARL